MHKTVLVTGASRGIGKAIALAFAKAGYHLVITCRRNQELLNQTYEEILSYPVNCHTFIGDLGNEDTVEELLFLLKENNIHINIVINNAAIAYYGLLQDMSLSQWNDVMNSNLTSAFLLSKSFIPDMISQKQGKIINISSVWGQVGASYEVAYSTSKGALNSFTKSLAKELAPSNIQVNAIACGIIDTEMNSCLEQEEIRAIEEAIPVGRMGRPEEVADLVLTITQSTSYLTGQIITLDGGWF